MNLLKRVNSLIGKKNKDGAWIRTTHILCKTYGWDYHTLINQPIPFVLGMIDQIQIEQEEEKRNMEKSKRKR